MHLEQVALVVDDYDKAIGFFVDALGFELVEDSPSLTKDGRPKRWVVVRPPGATTGLLPPKPMASDKIEWSAISSRAASGCSCASKTSTLPMSGCAGRASRSSLNRGGSRARPSRRLRRRRRQPLGPARTAVVSMSDRLPTPTPLRRGTSACAF
ncbi:VOC family protein [Nocardioides sp. B-3]|nr:VOC family protein [Nocardioides sp. B-3]UUZ59896.1 VOC family protein [Nocardioides sp. B-3]